MVFICHSISNIDVLPVCCQVEWTAEWFSILFDFFTTVHSILNILYHRLLRITFLAATTVVSRCRKRQDEVIDLKWKRATEKEKCKEWTETQKSRNISNIKLIESQAHWCLEKTLPHLFGAYLHFMLEMYWSTNQNKSPKHPKIATQWKKNTWKNYLFISK